MSALLDRGAALMAAWKAGAGRRALSELLGQEVSAVHLDRVHFPGRRPVQLVLSVSLRSGAVVPVLAEHCPGEAAAHAAEAVASLRKSRNGQREALRASGVVADAASGLVFRRPGLDERLPGLRLFHDAGAAREAVAAATGRDPGPVVVRLVAHRLGKRAVLRIGTAEGDLYARLRPVKSGDGRERLARHRALHRALGSEAQLRIPDPLGTQASMGLALFGALPGRPPLFDAADSEAIALALRELRALDPEGLAVHSGRDEARLLEVWLERCREYLPGLAALIAPQVETCAAGLAAAEGAMRTCHRDLHEKQALISGGIAGLLDFDTLSLAHPALDPGNLLAHLFFAGRNEKPLRGALERPGLALWRRAALLRLAMIHGFSWLPEAAIHRLIREAARDDRD